MCHTMRCHTPSKCICKRVQILDKFPKDQTTRGMVPQVTVALRDCIIIVVIHIHQSHGTAAYEAAEQLHILAAHHTSLPFHLLSCRKVNDETECKAQM